MRPFDARLGPHEEWAQEVFAHIEAHGWQVVPLGAERVAPDVSKVLSAMQNPDATARFVRYMPDGFAIHTGKEQAWFFDAKVGRSIEKDAYEAYMAFAGDERRVYVCIRWQLAVYWVSVRNIAFLDSREVVGGFREDHRMPIDDEEWIAPRLWPRAKYLRWKLSHPGASGTAFRYLDFAAMEAYRWKGGPVVSTVSHAGVGGRVPDVGAG